MKAAVTKLPANNTQIHSCFAMNHSLIHEKKSLSIFLDGNPFVQAKLRIGQSNDKYEQEADRVADQVMRMPEPGIQRQGGCPECQDEDERIQAKPIGDQITPLIQRDVESEEEIAPEGENVPEEDEEIGQAKLLESNSIQRDNIEGEEEQEEELENIEDKEESIQAKPLTEQDSPLIQKESDFEADDEEKDQEEDEDTPVQAKAFSNGESRIQRKEDGLDVGEDEEQEPVQSKTVNNQILKITSNLYSNIQSLKGGGQPLPQSARDYFEPRFGTDFGHVRIHTDSKASETAKSENARAFTLKNNVVFGSGQYSPSTTSGNRLLAHELAHVIQQCGSQFKPRIQRKETPGGFFSNIWQTFWKVVTFGAWEWGFSRETLKKYLKTLKKIIENDFDSDYKARNVVRLWKDRDPDFDLTAVQKVNLIKEMLEGWTSVWDEDAILDLLKLSSDADVERILGKGGVSYKRIKEDFSWGNLDQLEAFRKQRISSTDEELEKGIVKVQPKYIISSFDKKNVYFHVQDPEKGWVKHNLKRGRRVELLDHPEKDESKYPKKNYYYVRITAGRHRDKVGFVKKSDMFIAAKTSLAQAFKKDVKKPRKVSLVFFQNTERIRKKMEDIGAAMTTRRTHLWEEDSDNPSALKKVRSEKRIVVVPDDRKVYILKKNTFKFKKSKKAKETSSFFYVKAYVGSKGFYGYIEKSHLKPDIKVREGERDYFLSVAKKYVNQGRLRSIYVDPYSQKCEDRQYPIEYYAGSEIRDGIIGAKNCTNRLVTRIHIIAHGAPSLIAGYGDFWDSYGLYLKSKLKESISRNKEMRGLTSEEFSKSLKNYLDEDVSIWLHACSTAKKHEIETTGGIKKVKGFAEELAHELRVFSPKAEVRGFKTKSKAGRDPKGMVRYH